MELDRVRIFLAIVDAGSMSAAARVVHLTQPALSRTVKLLEEELGAALFERQGRGLVLSAAGRALEPRARALLAEAERVAAEVGRAAARGYHDLRLGVIESVAAYLVPRIVTPLRETFPGLAVRLSVARSGVLLRRVRDDALDLAVVAHSGPPLELEAERVAPYELQFYGRRDRFPELSKVRTTAALQAFPVVEIEPGHGEPGLQPRHGLSYAVASSVATVKALVMAGFGVGDLPAFVIAPDEARALVRAQVPHDPHCGLFVVAGDRYRAAADRAVTRTLCRLMAGARGPGARGGGRRRPRG